MYVFHELEGGELAKSFPHIGEGGTILSCLGVHTILEWLRTGRDRESALLHPYWPSEQQPVIFQIQQL